MAEKDEAETWPPAEKVDDRAIVHIQEGLGHGETLLGSGGQVPDPDEEKS
jgi:hypothetical protein